MVQATLQFGCSQFFPKQSISHQFDTRRQQGMARYGAEPPKCGAWPWLSPSQIVQCEHVSRVVPTLVYHPLATQSVLFVGTQRELVQMARKFLDQECPSSL